MIIAHPLSFPRGRITPRRAALELAIPRGLFVILSRRAARAASKDLREAISKSALVQSFRGEARLPSGASKEPALSPSKGVRELRQDVCRRPPATIYRDCASLTARRQGAPATSPPPIRSSLCHSRAWLPREESRIRRRFSAAPAPPRPLSPPTAASGGISLKLARRTGARCCFVSI
jgi:hypothetical protein